MGTASTRSRDRRGRTVVPRAHESTGAREGAGVSGREVARPPVLARNGHRRAEERARRGRAVSARTALRGRAGTTTDSNGNRSGLTPGRYNSSCGRKRRKPCDVGVATSGPIRITLKAGGTVSGASPTQASSCGRNVSVERLCERPGAKRWDVPRRGAPVGSVRVMRHPAVDRAPDRAQGHRRHGGGETYVASTSRREQVSGRHSRRNTGGRGVAFQAKGGSSGPAGPRARTRRVLDRG
jgi:hypothetical protein